MKPEDIHITDWLRILVGELPNSYFIEVTIRMIFTYLLLTICMRLMGRRMASQLSRSEMAALTSLAAAIGMPVLSPDRGLLPAVAVASIIVMGQNLVAWWASRNETFEAVLQDEIGILVKDGTLRLKEMKNTRISRQRLFEELRSSGLIQLGEVQRMYLEANGKFTLIKNEKPVPGLSLIPSWDTDFTQELKVAPSQAVCSACGNRVFTTLPRPTHEACAVCGNTDWEEAIIPDETEE